MKPTLSLALIFLFITLAAPILARPDGHVKDSLGHILR
ncbi:hypothetical protein AALP_AAs64679U000100, partial [Arabis alpina]